MFRIRRIHDFLLPRNIHAVTEIKTIFAEQFSAAPRTDIEHIEDKLHNPFDMGFRHTVYVAERGDQAVVGFAIVLHEPQLSFCYLDYIATSGKIPGRGIGAALYERIRDEALALRVKGLFFESLPDEPDRCRDPQLRIENGKRLKFYERYGVRPIINTKYEAALPGQSGDCMPHLLYDDLDTGAPLRRAFARKVVRAILERKYKGVVTNEYVQLVVSSFKQDPVQLREYCYIRDSSAHTRAQANLASRMPIVVNEKHEIHHVKDRGYVEAPARIRVILRELQASGLVKIIKPKSFSIRYIKDVHDSDFVDYLKRACESVPQGKSVYPYVFPIRNVTRAPTELSVRAGYYCIDTFTPLNKNAYLAARGAVNCTLTAAECLLEGERFAYALVRPPGHHAERRVFGGFCYFCNVAIAAQYLSKHGTVAILDIDYHHGNGQQNIFYERKDVLTVSLHGNPKFAYPYFTGFADEVGAGLGKGFNVNMVLAESLNGEQYREALVRALQVVKKFNPLFVVIALGLDPAKGDPTGTWSLRPKDFQANGALIRGLNRPTLVVQEGGYRTRTLGTNAERFFQGLLSESSKVG